MRWKRLILTDNVLSIIALNCWMGTLWGNSIVMTHAIWFGWNKGLGGLCGAGFVK